MDESLTTMYSFGRVNPDNPFSGGYVHESLYTGVYKKFRNCECIIYRLPVTEEQYRILVEELARFDAYQDFFRYNFLGLIAAGLQVPLKRKQRYFCSQFVSELLMKINVLKSDRSPELIRPTDLLFIEGKEEVFRGYVRDYIQMMDAKGSGIPSLNFTKKGLSL